MKKLFLLFLLSIFFSCGKSDQLILQETIDKLNTIKTVEYNVMATVLPKIGEDNNIHKANCYFDLRSKDQLIGAKYQFVSGNGDEQVFDGNKIFYSSVQDEKVLFTHEPIKSQVYRPFFSSGSLLEAKMLLPLFMKDGTITHTRKRDTVINGADSYRFDFSIPNRYVSDHSLFNAGNLVRKYVYTYQIAISKESMLPVFIKTKNTQSDRVNTYVLSAIKTDVSRDDSVWGYARFPDGYLKMPKKEYDIRKRKRMEYKVGFEVPDFTLRNLDGSNVSLSKLTQKLTLIEFWFPNCVNCIKAIPRLNEIQKKYKDQGLVIYGIEFTRPRSLGLKEYIEEHKIEIGSVYGGREMATELGIYAAPTFMLLNEQQKIVYVHIGYDQDGLLKAIDANL